MYLPSRHGTFVLLWYKIKTESLRMSPKDSLVNMEDKLSSAFSQWDLGMENSAQSLSGAQVLLLHGCVWSQWEWQDLTLDKGFSSLFVTVHSCLFAKAFLLMCMAR